MNKAFLKTILSTMNAKRESRLSVVNEVLKNNSLFPYLLEFTFNVSSKNSIKAIWVLEIICLKNIQLLLPYVNDFVSKLHLIYYEGAIRSASKICNVLAITFTSKNDTIVKETLTKNQQNAIIEVCFDWLIGQHKVATKAYAMNVLYLLGKNSDWVHQELKAIIEQHIVTESAAYKARGKITLSLINSK
jgi:hypothetical protein